jgi:hypothetical protein
MDLGVGGFMFAAGLTAPEAKSVEVERKGLKAVLLGCLPLLFLGTARLLGRFRFS